MLAQPRKLRLVARQAETTERELLAMRLQACNRPVRHWENPPKPIARSAEPRLSCGAWFGLGFVGSPVGNTTGDFLLALGLVARAASGAASSCSLSCPALTRGGVAGAN